MVSGRLYGPQVLSNSSLCGGNMSLKHCPASVAWLANGTWQRWHLGTSEGRLQEVMQLHSCLLEHQFCGKPVTNYPATSLVQNHIQVGMLVDSHNKLQEHQFQTTVSLLKCQKLLGFWMMLPSSYFICAWDEPGTRFCLNHGVKTRSPQFELIIFIFLVALGFEVRAPHLFFFFLTSFYLFILDMRHLKKE
jgi:hypothetical protein